MSENKQALINAAIKNFDSLYELDVATGADIFFDNAYIQDKVAKIAPMFLLTQDDIDSLVRQIKSIYSIYQPEGVAILDDYEHFDSWYENLDLKDEFFWNRYKLHLLKNGFPQSVIENVTNEPQRTSLNDVTKKLMSYLGNPNAEEGFARKGLVIGDVQSGKTSNYIGLIAKAADAGYKVIFLLTGTIESLRQQTQIRVEEGFIGYDSANDCPVGVGQGDIVPFAFTTREKDFVAGAGGNTALLIEGSSSRPYVFVIKKNVSVLKKIFSAIKRNLKGKEEKIKFPMLMIDDEADNASVNTNDKDNDPTQTNQQIRKILALFEKTNYVGFTATPFANIFIDPNTDDEMLQNDLFPKDFIYALFPPSNYHGAKRMFVDKARENSDAYMIEYIDKDDDTTADVAAKFPLGHKKEWRGHTLPNSVYEAIDRFLLANAIRDLNESNRSDSHRSMLINMSRFKNVQFHISEMVEEYLKTVRNDIKQSFKLTPKQYLQNESVARLYSLYNADYARFDYSWDKIFSVLFDAIKNITVVTVNSDKRAKKLNYLEHKNGFRVIAVGGLALSRGLTLEGLMISYFYRNTATFDVLMQMGRWFGYRGGYEKLCKIYITKISAAYYREIILSTEQLKTDMRKMCDRQQRPMDYGIRVRNDFYNKLRITAANKMKCTRQKIVHKDFSGEMFYTPFLDYGQDNAHNIKLTQVLISQNLALRDNDIIYPFFRDVDKTSVATLLKNLKINIDINDNFDTVQLVDEIAIQPAFTHFDILLMGGGNEPVEFVKGIEIKPVSRKYSLADGTLIKLNRHRLGGNRDTSIGLPKDVVERINNENDGVVNEKNYLIQGRNPILIVYLVRPSNYKDLLKDDDKDEDEQIEDILTLQDIKRQAIELPFEKKLAASDNPYLIGYQIGFPYFSSNGFQEYSHTGTHSTKRHRYITNINCDYYKLQGSFFDDGEDE